MPIKRLHDKDLEDLGFTKFGYAGPVLKDASSKFYLQKGMDFWAKPLSKSNVLFYSYIDYRVRRIPIKLAERIARYSKLRSKEKPKFQYPTWVLDSIWKWFLGSEVKAKKFYDFVSDNFKTYTVGKVYRVQVIPGAAIGSKVKLGPLTFYSGSLRKDAAAHGWTNWAEVNRVLDKHRGSKASIVEFSSAKTYGTHKDLVSLAKQASENRTAVWETAKLFKEVWLKGGQTGTVIAQVSIEALDKKYGM